MCKEEQFLNNLVSMKKIYQTNLIIGIMQWISIQKMKHS